jgi:hypothetical protein
MPSITHVPVFSAGIGPHDVHIIMLGKLIALMALNQAVKDQTVACTAYAPVLKMLNLLAYCICPGWPAPVLCKTTAKSEQSVHRH